MTDRQALLCGVELGGTKCVCVLGNGRGDIHARASIQTGKDPAVALARIEGIFREWSATHGPVHAIGIACFGPVELRRDSVNYGRVGSTPKEGWVNSDVAGFFTRRFAVAIGLDTDVNGAARAESRWGAARGLTDFAYITVGTGVGVGLIVAGRPVLGVHHPELGHIRVQRLAGDTWPGICRFHGDCVEGLASGPAIEASAGPPGDLPGDSPVWDTVAHAVAQLAHTLLLATAPQRILIGGGVMGAQPHLFPRIRERLRASLNGYTGFEQLVGGFDTYIAPPGLGALAGPLGALAVAADAYGMDSGAAAPTVGPVTAPL